MDAALHKGVLPTAAFMLMAYDWRTDASDGDNDDRDDNEERGTRKSRSSRLRRKKNIYHNEWSALNLFLLVIDEMSITKKRADQTFSETFPRHHGCVGISFSSCYGCVIFVTGQSK